MKTKAPSGAFLFWAGSDLRVGKKLSHKIVVNIIRYPNGHKN